MTVPLGFEIRVGRMADKLPYPVNVQLPSTVESETRDPPRTIGPELDIVIPTCNERHTALGVFMDSWSQMEQHLHAVLSMLLEIEVGSSEVVFSTMGMKQICDAIQAVALRKYSHNGADRLVNLTERLMKLNAKRNVLGV
ncbi:MAG: hypothetical protein V4458_06320 [Pseudomonadota bacterium]|nr:hypothetical protein [Afipia sp.]